MIKLFIKETAFISYQNEKKRKTETKSILDSLDNIYEYYELKIWSKHIDQIIKQ